MGLGLSTWFGCASGSGPEERSGERLRAISIMSLAMKSPASLQPQLISQACALEARRHAHMRAALCTVFCPVESANPGDHTRARLHCFCCALYTEKLA